MARLSLSLLGPLHVTLDGRSVGGFSYNKVRALLAYLAVEADRAHHRDALVGLLWPDQPDQAARTNLRQALAKLREAIGDGAATPPFLLTTRDTVQFNPESDFELDVATFSASLAECQRHRHRGPEKCRHCAERLEGAIALCRGDFLAQFSLPDSAPFEEWALLKREQLRQRALEMLVQLAAYHERRGAHEQARHHAQRQVELDPWREEAHQQLMRLLVRAGQRSEAIAQYETCKRLLAEALGVPPARETNELYERIRDGLELPAGNRAEAHQRLPAPPTALVGRERELKTLSELLSDPDCRLITITGPGGIGKTRLALEIARAEYTGFTHGAALINLAPLSEPGLIAPAILSGLGVPLQGQHDPGQQLIDYLQDKELLLVLDNFEHLLAGVSLITAIIERDPDVTLLLTSRERLALRAEWLVELGGLDCPDVDVPQGLEGYSAAQLFVRRARQAQSQFTLVGDPAGARAVARICRQVEGLPLAIELAAASVRHRSCAEIAAELEAGLHGLASAARDAPERHQSMRAAFEQSWRLLSDEERRAFRQLAVFRGGFDEAAATQIASASQSLLAALRDKSLLNRDPRGRYDIHELLQQYASEKLSDANEVEQTRARHLTYFVNLAEAAEPQLRGVEQQRWLDRLEAEHNNLNAALAWAHGRNDVETIAQMAGALFRYWYIRCHDSQGRHWLEVALAQKDRLPVAIRARALRVAGVLANSQQDYQQSREWSEEALASYRAQGAMQDVADVLNDIGYNILDQQRCDEAEPFFEESLSISRALNYTRGISIALSGLGRVALYQNDYVQARRLFGESLTLDRASSRKYNIVIDLCNLGLAALFEEDDLNAHRWFRESLVLALELGDKEDVASCLEGLAAIASRRSQPAQAAKLFGVAEKLRHQIGVPMPAPYQAHYERMKAHARARLGESAFEAAWAEGQTMTLEQAVADALKIDASG